MGQHQNETKLILLTYTVLPEAKQLFIKGTVSQNSAKLGNYKMPAKLTET